MFNKCKLLLSQNSKSLEITLNGRGGGVDVDSFAFWGSYSSSEGDIRPERKQWLFVLPTLELSLIDAGGPGVGMVGGGLKFGEMAALPPAAVLSHALMDNRGFSPIDSTGTGRGELLSGFAIWVQFNKGPISWEMSSYMPDASNAWVNP
jgi:hypothetical protein